MMAKTVPMIAAKAFPFRKLGRLMPGDKFDAPSERDARVLHVARLAQYNTKVMRAPDAGSTPSLSSRDVDLDAIPVFGQPPGAGALDTKRAAQPSAPVPAAPGAPATQAAAPAAQGGKAKGGR